MAAKKTRLWDKGEPLDRHIERFTVGPDPELDQLLLPYDALASCAHARGLARIGVIKEADATILCRALSRIAIDAEQGSVHVDISEEDGHTAIENRLTRELGDLGKRIHTGRSRNDQVIAATRLFGRDYLLRFSDALLVMVDSLIEFADKHKGVAVAGYTHTRQAMPTTMGHLLGAHAESLLDCLPWLQTAFDHLNRSALGSASGFGVALPLDRIYVAELLGCNSVQENTIAVQNDRGKTEQLTLNVVSSALSDMARLATDIILYSTDEFGYLSLAPDTTTGSSIMPQKRNPDIWELVRATASQVRCRQQEVVAVTAGLSSGYHRDLQLTKEPFLSSMVRAVSLMVAAKPALEGIGVNAQACADKLSSSIAATDEVYRRVGQGTPFRDAYREVGTDPKQCAALDPTETWKWRKHLGAPGALDTTAAKQRMADGRQWLAARRATVDQARDRLFAEQA